VKPPEPFTWFVDRSLGRKIVVDLRAAGFQVEEHSEHFADDAPDAEWLAEVGRRGWVVLTKDKAVRRNALELAAILASEVVCFSLGHGNLKAEQMAQAFVVARSRMEKVLRRYDPPMTASVTSMGHVSVLMAAGKLLPKPKAIK
jgi:predicted nuclease of predicted toxin-antitoxin system